MVWIREREKRPQFPGRINFPKQQQESAEAGSLPSVGCSHVECGWGVVNHRQADAWYRVQITGAVVIGGPLSVPASSAPPPIQRLEDA